MNLALTLTDTFQMSDAHVLHLAVAGNQILSHHDGAHADLGQDSLQLPYNSQGCGVVPNSAEDVAIPRDSAAEYLHKKEKEERIQVLSNVDMTSATPTIGTLSAPKLRDTSPTSAIVPKSSPTLADLLAVVALSVPKAKLPMLRVAAARVAEYLGTSVEQVPVVALASLGVEFKLALHARQYKDTSVRTYVHFTNVLRQHADALGMLEPNNELALAWAPVVAALGKQAGAASIIRYAIAVGRAPAQFDREDLRRWVQLMQRQRRSFGYTENERSRFGQAMKGCGFGQPLCEVFEAHGTYTCPMDSLPASLQAETAAVADWKMAKWSPGRKRGCKHRPVSANKLVRFIGQIYGFAATVQREPHIGSLAELITKNRLEAFVGWFINVRQRKAGPLRANLGLLAAALKQYPPLAQQNFGWLSEFNQNIEEDEAEQEQRRARKARRMLPYAVLAAVPDEIRAERERGGHSASAAALLVMYELLLRWWLDLPWRQRNLRELRLAGSNPNLFQAELPAAATKLRKIDWVQAELQKDPQAEFWQIRFSRSETKTGNEVHGIVPLELIPMLELYLRHRPALLKGPDPGTLFLNRGKAFNAKRLTTTIENITFKYAGSAVNPHLLRDIFAYNWLEEHPEDYVALSTILWHRDIKTTLRIYGSGFDETNGIIRIDAWRNSKKKKE
jgi:integrase